MQCILQSEDEVVRLVYSEFLEFLACANDKNSSDCWKCQHKQMLLELALYYHHFEIADKLIHAGNVCYTHVSLCNAAKHGDLIRVETILEALKRSQVFDPRCKEAKYALRRACLSGKNDLIEFLLQEGIMADIRQVIDAVQCGDIGVLKKVVEHLKSHNKWNPHWEPYSSHENFSDLFQQLQTPDTYLRERTENSIPYSTALFLSFCNEKFDMVDYLLKNEVDMLMCMLPALISYNTVKKAIQTLKDTENWYPKCDDAAKALENACNEDLYDVHNLLMQEGVSLTMKNLYGMVGKASFESIKKAIQNLKDTGNWYPKCDDASKALENACNEDLYDVYNLLMQEGVSLIMETLNYMLFKVSFESIKKVIQNLKDTENWDPKCVDAVSVLEDACMFEEYDVYDLLVQEGVSLTMENLYDMVGKASCESINKAIENLKDTGNWYPKCDEAAKVLENACNEDLYDVYNLLMQEGVSLTMKNLYVMVGQASFESIKKAIQNLKDTENWDPKCDDASEVLENAYNEDLYDVYNLLMQEGVSLTMKILSDMIVEASFESIKKAIQNLKDTGNWDPKCDDAAKALENACINLRYDVYDLLAQEGVSTTMKNLCNMEGMTSSESINKATLTMENIYGMVCGASFESVKKAIQNLKDTKNWDPKCDDATKALENACIYEEYDVYDLLIQEGVSLTMENLYDMVGKASCESIKNAIENLKDTGNWDPKCDDASKALENAYNEGLYNVYNLLMEEKVLLTMENLYDMVAKAPFESIKKAIENLKDTLYWDPMSSYASKALENAYNEDLYDVYNLLMQEGVSLTMENLYGMVGKASCESIKKAIQNLKDTGNWDPKCDDAFEALENACINKRYDVYDLLIQEGVSLTMKNLYVMVGKASFESIKKAIQNLKDTGNWDPKCDDAAKALENACINERYDVYDLLVQEGVSLTMKNLYGIAGQVSFESIKKAIQNLKDTGNWDPKCDDAAKALENACINERYDVYDLLIQEGVALTMKNLYGILSKASFESIKKAIQNLKDTGNWDPKCDGAFKALKHAYVYQKYNICDLLIQEGVSLTMKTFFSIVHNLSFAYIKNAVKNLKASGSWYPRCGYASNSLMNAFIAEKYDVCDLLFQESVSLQMKHLPSMVSSGSFESIKKAIQNLKDTRNWDPDGDDAFKALKIAFSKKRYDICDLLVQEGISLTMKKLPIVVFRGSFKYVKRTIQHLKKTDSWYPECDDAYIALLNAYSQKQDDVYYLLVQMGISLTMKNLPPIVCSGRLQHITKVIQHLKDTKIWDPQCDDASEALENAYKHRKYDVCDLLIQKGVLFNMKNHSLPVYN
ncbi:hypothetical protein CHS0354_040098, partial [Potamilus streckersoni]